MSPLSFIRAAWQDETRRQIVLIVVSAIALLLGFFDVTVSGIDLSWVAILLCGTPIVIEAAIGLITRFDVKADLLVSLALIASIIIGEYFAAGEIAVIMQLGALLEEMTVAKARKGIERLASLAPETARVVTSGTERIIPASEVKKGETIRVNPGETVPVDGEILSGSTSVDESVLTGEPMPVDKTAGDHVMSGSINRFGVFELRADAVGDASTIARMAGKARRICGREPGENRAACRSMGNLDRGRSTLHGLRHMARDRGGNPCGYDSRRLLPVRPGACNADGRHGSHRMRHEAGSTRTRRGCA